MNIDQMAHEFVMNCIKNPTVSLSGKDIVKITSDAWVYADFMQAEADKRKTKGLPEVLQDEFNIDWSQAPDNAIAWKMNKYKYCMWLQEHNNPAQSLIWLCDAPSFNYIGDWKNSLRKRP